jgi:hypothetical protein
MWAGDGPRPDIDAVVQPRLAFLPAGNEPSGDTIGDQELAAIGMDVGGYPNVCGQACGWSGGFGARRRGRDRSRGCRQRGEGGTRSGNRQGQRCIRDAPLQLRLLASAVALRLPMAERSDEAHRSQRAADLRQTANSS